MNMFLIALLGGFAGSFHCVGMCGGFACGLSHNTTNKRLLAIKTVSYNTGRLMSYVFIGAMVGALGSVLIGTTEIIAETDSLAAGSVANVGLVLRGEFGFVQRALSVAAGVLMLVMALQLFGIRRHIPSTWGRLGGVAIARTFQALLGSDRPSASLALGVANGFLPCPLVYAFAAIAASSATVLTGALTMFAFGLGTFPAMFLMSSLGLVLSPAIRRGGVRMAGYFVLIISVVTILRGIMPSSMHSMHPM